MAVRIINPADGTSIPIGVSTPTILVSNDDTTPDYIATKLVAGTNMTLNVLNDGANETLEFVASSGGGGTGSIKMWVFGYSAATLTSTPTFIVWDGGVPDDAAYYNPTSEENSKRLLFNDATKNHIFKIGVVGDNQTASDDIINLAFRRYNSGDTLQATGNLSYDVPEAASNAISFVSYVYYPSGDISSGDYVKIEISSNGGDATLATGDKVWVEVHEFTA